MPEPGPKNEDEAESKRILDRVSIESDVHGGAMFQRSRERARNKAQRSGKRDEDWIEQTGTRIARYLSVVLLVAIVVWFASVIWNLGSGG